MKTDELKNCPYCGGKPEYKHKKKKFQLTIGMKRSGETEERYIRCLKCHARTPAYGKLINVINAWQYGVIYEANRQAG